MFWMGVWGSVECVLNKSHVKVKALISNATVSSLGLCCPGDLRGRDTPWYLIVQLQFAPFEDPQVPPHVELDRNRLSKPLSPLPDKTTVLKRYSGFPFTSETIWVFSWLDGKEINAKSCL